jgi:CO/xanthine dehydrogenase Mo-binding subunit
MCSTQGVYGARTALAQVLGLPQSQVRVQYYDGGGSYGHTTYNDVAEAAAIMSQTVGKPVRAQFMRWDEHGWDNHAPSHIGDVRAGIDATGKIVAYSYTGWSQDWISTETTQELVGTPIAVPRVGGAASDIFNNTGDQYTIANSVLIGKTMPMLGGGLLKAANMRAPLGPQTNFASEQIIDQLSVEAGMDPVAFRLHNQADPSVVYWTGVLNAVAKAANWHPKVSGSNLPHGDVVAGRGIALGTHTTPTSYAGVVADIQVNKKTGVITVKHLYAAMNVGLTINPGLVANQMTGCLIMGCSRALAEAVRFSKTNVTSLDWVTYPILRFAAHPNVTTVVVQQPDQPSSGAGEESMPPVTGAIANAFFDATGVRMHQMPMTPGAVRATLRAARIT